MTADSRIPDAPPTSQNREKAEYPFGSACFGGGVGNRCKRPPEWQTTQSEGANPMNACHRHIGWLLRLRTSPTYSITVTRLT